MLSLSLALSLARGAVREHTGVMHKGVPYRIWSKNTHRCPFSCGRQLNAIGKQLWCKQKSDVKRVEQAIVQ